MRLCKYFYKKLSENSDPQHIEKHRELFLLSLATYLENVPRRNTEQYRLIERMCSYACSNYKEYVEPRKEYEIIYYALDFLLHNSAFPE